MWTQGAPWVSFAHLCPLTYFYAHITHTCIDTYVYKYIYDTYIIYIYMLVEMVCRAHENLKGDI